MCGIAGILNLTGRKKHMEAIQAMTNRIIHRGPDAEGLYVDEYIALGHRRLSIIDLQESANQPMWDVTGRYAIVYNGEIYNYQEVKRALPEYPFKTQSDTEVILAAYATWGVDCLQHFNGMFAFSIWDSTDKVLFAARDRVGKKPYYYYTTSDHFVFGSEVRSLLASGLVPRKLMKAYIPEFLMYQAAIGDHTMVAGVKRLQAGHYALIKDGIFQEKRYWSLDTISLSSDPSETVRNKVRDLLLDSVRLRMIADVPIGAFLSGGIDSSIIVACMAELSNEPVNTFTVSFDEKKFDESGFAQQIASKYNTRHHRLLIKPEEFLSSVEEILGSMDTPSGDGPNTYLVARHTRATNIKVALSGLGGDELFAGYNKFLMYHRLMRKKWLLKFPRYLRHKLADFVLAGISEHKSTKLAYLIDLDQWDLSTVYPILRRAYSLHEINRLLTTPHQHDHVVTSLSSMGPSIAWMEHFSQCTIGELETYTRDVLLRDTDQMSMAHSLEVRVPFLDYRLVEYILSLPDKIKYPHTPKQLLVDSMAPRIPQEISQRRKMGFTLPMDHWLKNELATMAQQKIHYLSERPEFNGKAVMKKWQDYKKGDTHILWSRIWKLVVLSDWMQRNQL